MHMTQEVAARATCDRGRSGCVVVLDKRIIATGYVGSPPGLPHCDEVGHLLKRVLDDDGTARQHCMRTIHAEQNAICQAAKYGLSLNGATVYCKMEPCRVCAMLIISVGIVRVVAHRRYHAAQDTREMFKAAGVELAVLEDSVETYVDQVVVADNEQSRTNSHSPQGV
jgi:dCMP deaminase